FAHDMDKVGVGFHAGRMSESEPTGRCIIAVTPDGQHSMSTFLGAASLLDRHDISREAVQSAAVVFLEGYLFDRDHAKDAFRVAAKYAHEAGRKVSLTLSDSFCVDRHRDDFMDLILNDIDVLFCNEFELMSLYQVDDYEEALGQLRRGTCSSSADRRV
ncbi:MAG: PfkB family carbohydrate kinase, partial [Actinomycetota bacterium]